MTETSANGWSLQTTNGGWVHPPTGAEPPLGEHLDSIDYVQFFAPHREHDEQYFNDEEEQAGIELQRT